MTDRIRSEQQESLEPEASPTRAAGGGEEPAPQFTQPGGGGEPGDTEPTEIADPAGVHESIGPEHQAVSVEADEDASGRTGDATSGYLDEPDR